jgi:hypothetical protein
MAKKKISIDKIEIGMLIEADVRGAVGGKGATPASGKNVLLLGKGMLIISQNQVRRLKEAGLNGGHDRHDQGQGFRWWARSAGSATSDEGEGEA